MNTTSNPLALLSASVLGAALLIAASVEAQDSGEYWVDGPDDIQPGSDRRFSDVGIRQDGTAIHVWDAFAAQRHDVFVRLFSESGSPTLPLRVNSLTEDDQFFPRVAVQSDGSFYVVWQSDEFDPEQEQNRHWVRGQLFGADGLPAGSELLISEVSSGTSTDIDANVAALDDGGFIVTWESFNGFEDDSQPCGTTLPVGCDSLSVQARLISAEGSAIGGQFQVNADVSRSQSHPAVVATADGGFAVFWGSSSRNVDVNGSIQGRRFSANGASLGPEFRVDTTTEGLQGFPEAARDDDGRILVVFESPGANDTSVRARLYDADLEPAGDDFLVPSLSPDFEQFDPKVAGGIGYFMVVWTANGALISDPNTAVNGRIVRDRNQFDGTQFQVNLFEEGSQTAPGVGAEGAKAVVSWRSNPINAFEQDDGIIARAFNPDRLFFDGFE